MEEYNFKIGFIASLEDLFADGKTSNYFDLLTLEMVGMVDFKFVFDALRNSQTGR